jgi:hypothetical protein
MNVSGHLHAQPALYQGKKPRYPLDRKLGGPQNRSRYFCRTEKCLTPAGIRTPNSPARSLFTTISRLSSCDGVVTNSAEDMGSPEFGQMYPCCTLLKQSDLAQASDLPIQCRPENRPLAEILRVILKNRLENSWGTVLYYVLTVSSHNFKIIVNSHSTVLRYRRRHKINHTK